jgi:hypothetical protein
MFFNELKLLFHVLCVFNLHFSLSSRKIGESIVFAFDVYYMNAIIAAELFELGGIEVILQAIETKSGVVILPRSGGFGSIIFFLFDVILGEGDASLKVLGLFFLGSRGSFELSNSCEFLVSD